MFCTHCGADVKDGFAFCTRCGAPLRVSQAANYDGGGSIGHAAEGGVADERANLRQAKMRAREANEAYRNARKAAGKSSASKIIGVILVIVAVAVIGGGVAWYFTGGKDSGGFPNPMSLLLPGDSGSSGGSDNSGGSDDPGSSDSSGSSDDPGSSDSSGSASTDLNVVAQGVLGTWSGEMTETRNTTSWNNNSCYGAQHHPMRLEITGFESTGMVTARAEVMVHGHSLSSLDRDVSEHENDVVVVLEDLIGTYSDGHIKFKSDTSKGFDVEITLDIDDHAADRVITARVLEESNKSEDTYRLTREG